MRPIPRALVPAAVLLLAASTLRAGDGSPGSGADLSLAAPAHLSPAGSRGEDAVPDNPVIDPGAFLRDAAESVAVRGERRLDEATFRERAWAKGAILLDARSRELYDLLHLEGARSLPLTEFTADTLAALVPDPETPIFVYCNNNFAGAELEFPTKLPPSALNLFTTVSLWTYGYRNVWELGPFLDVATTKLPLAGANAEAYRHAADAAAATTTPDGASDQARETSIVAPGRSASGMTSQRIR